MSPTTADLLDTPQAPQKRLPAIADRVREAISGLFPDAFLNVKFSDNIMDSVGVWFATTKKEAWANGIFHNSDYIILRINEAGRQHERGTGPYVVECSSGPLYRKLRFIKKTGTEEQVMTHITRYFTKLREVLNPTTREEAPPAPVTESEEVVNPEAAPELLAALRAVYDEFMHYRPQGGSHPMLGGRRADDVEKQVRAAIAKATRKPVTEGMQASLDDMWHRGYNEEPHNLDPDEPRYARLLASYNDGVAKREKDEAEGGDQD